MQILLYAVAVVAGLMNPLQTASTSMMNKVIDRPLMVGVVSALGTLTVTLAGTLVFDQLGFGGKAAAIPWWAWLGGLFGSVFLLSQPVAAQRIGAGPFIGLTVTAAVIASVLIDNYGWLGFERHAASWGRIAGAALMIGGVGLVALF